VPARGTHTHSAGATGARYRGGRCRQRAGRRGSSVRGRAERSCDIVTDSECGRDQRRGCTAGDLVGSGDQFAGHWIVGKTIGGPWKVRVAEEYNAASGDASPNDGRRQTFDQLYPTGHDKLGLADQVGWKNIRDLRSIVELTPYRGWPGK